MNARSRLQFALLPLLSAIAVISSGTGCGNSIAILEVSPQQTTLMAGASQQFSVNVSEGTTRWSVVDPSGGCSDTGTIDANGIYRAPLIACDAPIEITAINTKSMGSAAAVVHLINPAPTLAIVNPRILTATGSEIPVKLTGTGFTPHSVVIANGNSLSTKYVSDKELAVVLPPSSVTNRVTLPVGVVTPAPGGGTANLLQVPILSPGAATVNVSNSLQFNLPELPGGTVWSVNGHIGGSADLGLISSSGLYTGPPVPPEPLTITAASKTDASFVATALLTVKNPVPEITNVDLSAALAVAPLAIRVSGSSFTVQSVVYANEAAAPTTYVSDSELLAVIPQEQLSSAEQLKVSVYTPGPGGGESDGLRVTLISPGEVKPTEHPQVAQYNMALPSKATMTVDFGLDEQYGRQTWTRTAPDGGGTVSILVAGMKAEMNYHLRAQVQLPSGVVVRDLDHIFTTGSLPQGLPAISVSKPNPSSSGGVDLISAIGKDIGAVVTDLDGSIIWYYPNAFTFPIREASNGNFIVNSGFEVREVDLAGHTIRRVTADQINSALLAAGYSLQITSGAQGVPIHHEVIRLENGHWIVLVNEDRELQISPGDPTTTTVSGDAVVDLDENNNVVWVWRAFDHLDINRRPIWFPDWTHANAIVYTPDGNLLLSMRHQNWIIKIDYNDGRGLGDVIWRLGPEGDFNLSGGDPAQWFYNQHFPVLVDATGSQLKLALYDNGDMRPDSNLEPCYLNNVCFSRGLILTLDESTLVSNITWQYTPGWFSSWGGSISVLPNGNVEFDSSSVDGGTSRVIELSGGSNPQIVWEMDTDALFYRAYRIPSLYPGVQW